MSTCEVTLEATEALKVQGNQQIQKGNITAAVAFYSQAISAVFETDVYREWKVQKGEKFGDETPEENSNKKILAALIKDENRKSKSSSADEESTRESSPVESQNDLALPFPIHVYFSNRAQCHIKLENLGLALSDANQAVEHDPKYWKGFYRRACARLLLQKYEHALVDFQIVWKMTNDVSAGHKVKHCRELFKAQLFANAISSDKSLRVSETIDWTMVPSAPSSYTGPNFEELSSSMTPEAKDIFFNAVVKFLTADIENRIPKVHVYKLLIHVINYLKTVPTLVHVDVPKGQHITVCGDVHGQFYDLINIFKINGNPGDENPYLFNGDFVDRGSFSIEIILTLFLAKRLWPNSFHLARGNHETHAMNSIHGFLGETKEKYEEKIYNLFSECFRLLPLAHVIRNEVFVVHGGLFSRDNVTLAEIAAVNRDTEPADSGLMTEMLWSDPQPENGRAPSKRGVATMFGPDVTENFLSTNNLRLLVRSHEMKEEGYSVEHDGKCITVFSAANYCDQMGNQGAFVKFYGDEDVFEPHFTKFDAVPHPTVRANYTPMMRQMMM